MEDIKEVSELGCIGLVFIWCSIADRSLQVLVEAGSVSSSASRLISLITSHGVKFTGKPAWVGDSIAQIYKAFLKCLTLS